MDRKRRVEQHTWAGNEPETWRACADNLLAAAAVLRERREAIDSSSLPVPNAWRLHPPELMLAGMAMECLLKAVWVKRGNKLAEDGRYVRVPGERSHDLLQLARVLHLTLSDLDKDVLRRLSHFMKYGGRHPVPKDAEELQLITTPRGGRAISTHWSTPGDQVLFNALVSRLENLLNAD